MLRQSHIFFAVKMLSPIGLIIFTALFLCNCATTAERLPAAFAPLEQSCQINAPSGQMPSTIFRQHYLGQRFQSLTEPELTPILADSLGKVFELCPPCSVEYYRRPEDSLNRLHAIVVNCHLDSPQETKLLFERMITLLSNAYQTPAQPQSTTSYFWFRNDIPLKIALMLQPEYHTITLNYSTPPINTNAVMD
jgi:hypothetical protein